jgi:hypothetical protein
MGPGFFRYIEPVETAPVRDTETLKQAFLRTVRRGNPSIPNIPRSDAQQPVLPKYAGLKTWSAFARGAIPWSVSDEAGQYQIIGQKKRPDRGWEDDPDQTVTLPEGSTLDELSDRLIAILQTRAGQK